MAANLEKENTGLFTVETEIHPKMSVEMTHQPCIHDLPEEILILIFGLTSPYRDFKSIMLVCQEWNSIMTEVIRSHKRTFFNAIAGSNLTWHCHDQSIGVTTPTAGRSTEHRNVAATVTERYSHSACYYDKSVYVFGGCASTSTTFNDLWRFDLGLRAWIRPLVTGSYPSPKACATLTAYKDRLVLFGGWSHHSQHILHQSSKFFNQLHIFQPSNNKWTLIDPSINGPDGKAGHGATVIGDRMIVFGGYQGLVNSCHDVWVLDLLTMNWTLQETSGTKPSPRYSHAQAAIDDHHILVLGGCGGPNMQLTDAWLLTISLNDPWKWEELSVVNLEQSAPQLMCHQACLIKDKLVVLSKNSKVSPPVYLRHCTNPCRLPTLEDKPKLNRLSSRDQSGGISVSRNDESNITDRESQSKSLECDQLQVLNGVAVCAGVVQPKRCCPDSSDSDSEDACLRPLYTNGPYGGAMLCALTLRNAETTRKQKLEKHEQSSEVMSEQTATSSVFSANSPGAFLLGHSLEAAEISVSVQVPLTSSTGPGSDLCSPLFSPGPVGELHCELPSPTECDFGPHRQPTQSVELPSGSHPQFSSTPRPILSPGSRPGLPSIRPNAMKNRQRQLDTLQQYEERLRSRKVTAQVVNAEQGVGLANAGNISQNRIVRSGPAEISNAVSATGKSRTSEGEVNTPTSRSCCCNGSPDYQRFHRTPLHPMFVHTLDLSEAVTRLRVTWLPISVGDSLIQGGDPPPEETIFYSLVEGRGELVMFGGIQGDMASMQRAVSPTNKNVTNAVYSLSAPTS